MVKRLFDLKASEAIKLSRQDLLQSIKAAEGRVILSENDVTRGPVYDDITNSELAKAASADLILLNKIDLFNIHIPGLEVCEQPIQRLKELVGRPIGCNLEPVITSSNENNLYEPLLEIVPGRVASLETLEEANDLGLDFICLTGNPKTGVSVENLVQATHLARQYFKGAIFAGKMHASGIDEPIVDEATVQALMDAGADVILIPSVGTNPGVTYAMAERLHQLVHQNGKLVMSVNGTSQDCSRVETIRQIAMNNKMMGSDIHHIGSSGTGGLAPYENIFELSVAIRGHNHTIRVIASSLLR